MRGSVLLVPKFPPALYGDVLAGGLPQSPKSLNGVRGTVYLCASACLVRKCAC